MSLHVTDPEMCCTTSVFRKLGYWDEESKKPFEDKTVTFEHYLELVCGCVIRDGKQFDHIRSAGSILKRKGTFSGESLMSPQSVDAEATQSRSEPNSPVRAESLKFRFLDDPTDDLLEQEWQDLLQKEKNKHKQHHDHAEEGAAFKHVKAAEKETGDIATDETSPDASAEACSASEAAVPNEAQPSAAAESEEGIVEQECDADTPSKAARDSHAENNTEENSSTFAAGGDRRDEECAQVVSVVTCE